MTTPGPGSRRLAVARLGRGHQLQRPARRAVPARRRLRPHRLHRHVDLDRPAEPDGRHLPDQPRPHLGTRAGDRACGRQVATIVAGGDRAGQRPEDQAVAKPVRSQCRHRRARSGEVRPAEGPQGRAGHQPHRPRPRRAGPTIDLLHKAEGVKLVALFSPEHGIRGELDERTSATARTRRPACPSTACTASAASRTPRRSRASTRWSTTSRTSAAASTPTSARSGWSWRRRPSTRSRWSCSTGPTRSAASPSRGRCSTPGRESFVAYHTLPVRHGMTVGELAKMFNAERKLDVELDVVKCEGWRRGDLFDRTGLTWVNPSPNMRQPDRGAALPRHRPAGDDERERRPRHRTAVRVDRGAVARRPQAGGGAEPAGLAGRAVRAGEPDAGVQRPRQEGVRRRADHRGRLVGVQPAHDRADGRRALCATCSRSNGRPKSYDRLLVHKASYDAFKAGKSVAEIERSWAADLKAFRARRNAAPAVPGLTGLWRSSALRTS